MKISITYRLFLSILTATGLAILALLLIMQWSMNRGFIQYLGKMGQARLEQITVMLGSMYEVKQSWEFLKTSPPTWELLANRPASEREAGRPGATSSDNQDSNGPLVILDANKKIVFGSYSRDEDVDFLPISAHGKVVGYAGLLSPKHFLHPVQIQFLSQQKLDFAIAAAVMVLLVVLISLPLARRLLKPVRAMAQATHDISSGKYTTRISFTSSDELGQLARDFNNMASILEKHERDRRQWIADISHELRTPIAVLRGEIEALLDGIRSVTPETIRSLHADVLRLNRLVEDLYQLSLSDIGALSFRKEDVHLGEVLRDSIESYSAEFEQKGISLTNNVSENMEVIVFADGERLNQLFTNLFENSLRYTAAGGNLAISLAKSGEHALIELQDSAPGVPEKDLNRLFERLYRVEGSRSRSSGGAGLGLAICKNIVEAHEGSISAHQSQLGGLLIRITLPISRRSA